MFIAGALVSISITLGVVVFLLVKGHTVESKIKSSFQNVGILQKGAIISTETEEDIISKIVNYD